MVETASSTEEIVEGSAKLGVPKWKAPKEDTKYSNRQQKKKQKNPAA